MITQTNNLMQALSVNTTITMSSREIADIAQARHNDVIATIVRLFDKGLLRSSRKTRQEATGGRPIEVFDLIERDVYLVISGYNDEVRARIIDRWQELESRKPDPMEVLSNPALLRQALLGYSEQVIALQKQNTEMTPKVEALDRISTANGSLCITDAAKSLQVQPKKLFQLMNQKGWIYRRTGKASWIAHQEKIKQLLLEHKITTVERDDGTEKITEQVRVTPKGMTRLALLVKELEAA